MTELPRIPVLIQRQKQPETKRTKQGLTPPAKSQMERAASHLLREYLVRSKMIETKLSSACPGVGARNHLSRSEDARVMRTAILPEGIAVVRSDVDYVEGGDEV